jgi:amino acid transporter
MSDIGNPAVTSSENPAGSAAGASDKLFVRNSTGLVRGLSQRDNLILAALAGVPAVYLATGVFFSLSGLPGGNLYIGALLTIPLMIAFSGSFGLMTAAIPRSGGDYTIVGRILSPGLGMVSSFCMLIGGCALSGAFVGRIAATLGVAPSLQTVGVVSHSQTLVDWGNSVATGKGWWFLIGTLMFVSGAAAHWAGHRWMRRAIYTGFFGSSAGLLVATLIAVFTSQHEFASAFNSTTSFATGSADNYNAILAAGRQAGVNLDPSFSWYATIGCLGVFATSTIYTYFGSFAGGELRQASSSKTWTRMALGGGLTIVIDVICIYFLVNSYGRPFLTAAFGGGFPEGLGSISSYFTLTSFQVGNTLFAALLCLSFLVVFWMIATQLFLATTRAFFAWSFDGVLPERFSGVSKRTHAPTAAIVLSFVLFLVVLAWGVFLTDNLLAIIVYATLIQMVAMMLVGLAAVVFPYRHPELYRASGIHTTIAGVPLVVIMGVASILSGIFVFWLYFHYSYFGLADKGTFLAWFVGIAGGGAVYYLLARWIRKRQGTDLSLVYAEIPPE